MIEICIPISLLILARHLEHIRHADTSPSMFGCKNVNDNIKTNMTRKKKCSMEICVVSFSLVRKCIKNDLSCLTPLSKQKSLIDYTAIKNVERKKTEVADCRTNTNA